MHGILVPECVEIMTQWLNNDGYRDMSSLKFVVWICTVFVYVGTLTILIELLFRKENRGRALMDKVLNVVAILLVGALFGALISAVGVRWVQGVFIE